MKLPIAISSLIAGSCLFATSAQATIVEFITSQGNVRVNLHDTTTPATVENFLKYVTDGDYVDTVIHRVETDFVIQGGGFKYDDDGFNLAAIDTDSTITNEPVWSNVKGTIAMAKVGGNPNSATSQWFFNTANNSANLDLQNGGFTVFGQVVAEDMAVLESINELLRCANDFGSTPMVNYSAEQCTNGEEPGYENFVTIYSIDIIDDTAETDSELNKVENTLIDQDTNDNNSDSSGGGSLYWLLAFATLGLSRRFK